jgi:cell division protein FtsB
MIGRVKIATYVLAGFLVLLQYPLWLGSGGAVAYWQLRRSIDSQKTENARLLERNRALQAEVINLKSGLDAIEERARAELGMIKRDETFFQVVTGPEQ